MQIFWGGGAPERRKQPMEAFEGEEDPRPGAEVESTTVWIESATGPIVRGVVEVLSEDGALAILPDLAELGAGEDVTVRLLLDRSQPTLAATARVLSIRRLAGRSECELAWTHSGAEREMLATIVASLG